MKNKDTLEVIAILVGWAIVIVLIAWCVVGTIQLNNIPNA